MGSVEKKRSGSTERGRRGSVGSVESRDESGTRGRRASVGSIEDEDGLTTHRSVRPLGSSISDIMDKLVVNRRASVTAIDEPGPFPTTNEDTPAQPMNVRKGRRRSVAESKPEWGAAVEGYDYDMGGSGSPLKSIVQESLAVEEWYPGSGLPNPLNLSGSPSKSPATHGRRSSLTSTEPSRSPGGRKVPPSIPLSIIPPSITVNLFFTLTF